MARKKRKPAPSEHQTDCPCDQCNLIRGGMSDEQAWATIVRWQDSQLATHGWYAHEVRHGADNATGFSLHTHGLEQGWLGHPDLEIAMPMPSEVGHTLLAHIVARVKAGETFSPGQQDSEVIQGYDVLFVTAREGDRTVLRMILPDKEGRLGRDMDHPFAHQYDDIPED